MRYGKEVIGLLGAYPGREFVMRQIVRHINPRATTKERAAIKKGVQRVMVVLAAMGNVSIVQAKTIGATARYSWND